VNFVVVNGDDRNEASSVLVERFRVDGIPHLALMTKEGEVKTALIGARTFSSMPFCLPPSPLGLLLSPSPFPLLSLPFLNSSI